jgi:putative endonuclease
VEKATPKSTETGRHGEQIALEFLESNGYKIIKRNFHFGRYGEIDLIGEKDGVLIFFEVKVQTTDAFGDPRFWITASKQQKLRKAASGYLYINKIEDRNCRFDAIVIDLRTTPPQIEHIKNAF